MPILNESIYETPGAQLHMLTNIPVKCPDRRSNTFGATCDTSRKLQIFAMSRAITKPILQESTSETPGVQLHIVMASIKCWMYIFVDL